MFSYQTSGVMPALHQGGKGPAIRAGTKKILYKLI
jgi:hypothetical protein